MKTKRIKTKGFTLTEILFTIILLSLIVVIVVISINNILKTSKEKYYIELNERITSSINEYYEKNKDKILTEVAKEEKISLKTLVDENILKDIKDHKGKECDINKSYIQLYKYSNKDYSALTYLECPSYSTTKQNEQVKPKITIDYADPKKSKKAYVTIKIKDENRLMNYTYKVYRYGKEIKKQEITPIKDFNYEFETIIDLTEYVPGEIKVEVTAKNVFNKETKEEKSKLYEDITPPTCIIKDADLPENKKTWINTSREITIECDDKDGTGCVQKTYTKTFDKTTETGIIQIADQAGNKTDCKVSVNVDKDKPSCTLEIDGIKGNNNWYKEQPAIIKITATDKLSGVQIQGISNESTPVYNSKVEHIQSDTEEKTIYGYVKDNAGNTSMCETKLKVDTTKPTCTLKVEGTKTPSLWYNSKVKIKIETNDLGPSGVAKSGLSSTTEVKLDNKKEKEQSDTQSTYWYGQVEDKAGNMSALCQTEEIKVDTTPPAITLEPKPGTHNIEKDLIVSATCTDNEGGSGIQNKTNDIKITSPLKEQKVVFECTDNAGNTKRVEETYSLKTYGKDASCGVETYKTCEHKECGETDECLLWACYSKNNKIMYYTENNSEKLCKNGTIKCTKKKTSMCQNEACGIENYKECWHY